MKPEGMLVIITHIQWLRYAAPVTTRVAAVAPPTSHNSIIIIIIYYATKAAQ